MSCDVHYEKKAVFPFASFSLRVFVVKIECDPLLFRMCSRLSEVAH